MDLLIVIFVFSLISAIMTYLITVELVKVRLKDHLLERICVLENCSLKTKVINIILMM